MNRARMLAELRVVLNEASVPAGSGWDDTTLTGYLSEGQDKFCELTGYFVDKSNFSLTLQTGVAIYDIPTRAVQILDIWDSSRKLGKWATGNTSEVEASGNFYPDTIATGAPTMWRTDQETGGITLSPVPTAEENGDVYTMQVWRYSQSPLDRTSSTITLTGSIHAGDLITAAVNDVVFSYAVFGSEGTLSAVATALAAVIGASTVLTATASGQVVSISADALETSTVATVVVSGAGATVVATAADVYSAAPEIPSRFQRACIEWAAYKALNHHDMDTQDKVKARDHLGAFNIYVQDGINALRRIQNQEVRVTCDPTYRT